MKSIFLSASIPERGRAHFETSDPIAIRDAVRALVGVSLANGYELVFGGHPAISPLVLQVATGLGHDFEDRVVIYQSRAFEGVIPKDSLAFRHFVWTSAVLEEEKLSRARSLTSMRTQMIRARPYERAFFIGGMEGVDEEYRLFAEILPCSPRHCVASAGGAAGALWQGDDDRTSPFRAPLRESRNYTSLFRSILH